MTNTLKIIYWNANSLLNKIFELYSYLDDHQIDIACINETFFKAHHHIHSHPDYVTYRLDRDAGAKGGVAIIMRRELFHCILPHPNLHIIEAISVEITLHGGRKIIVTSAYLPGSMNRQEIQHYFVDDIQKITNHQTNYFICGDLNAKHRHWNCTRANLAGQLLFNKLVSSNFVIEYPPSPTYYPEDVNRQPSTIDLVVTNSADIMTEPCFRS